MHPPCSSLLAFALVLGAALPAGAQSGAVPGRGPGAAVAPDKQPPAKPDDKNTVIPPVLTKFVDAPYPEEATKAGLEGNVVLQLDIDAEGKVTNATVVNPVGHGFDEAAVAAARQFLFAPATRAGKPVPARILYRYSFTLKVVEPQADPGKSKLPAGPVKNLSGVVRAGGGEVPLAGAVVTLRDAAGAEKVVTTSEDGTWSFTDLTPGQYSIKVKAPGYQALDVQERVAANEATEVVYRLTPEGELQVVIRGQRPPREVTKRTIERREIERIPGTNGDALRSLQNLPGVARPPAFAGLLIIRGSAPNDTNIFIDGTLVPIVYHFGGLSSVVPTEMLEKIDFYPGNFSTQYGRVTGGIVDVGLRSPRTDGKYHGLAQADLIDARAMLEGPIPLLKGWNFVAGVRRSWVDTWLKPVLTQAGASVTAAPVYYDYQILAETQPTKRSSFRLSFIGSDDRLELLVKDTSDQEPTFTGNFKFHTGFYRLAARYRNDLSDAVSLSSVTAWGKDSLDVGIGALFLTLDINTLSNRTEVSTKIGSGATLHTGVDMLWGPTTVEARIPAIPREGEPDPGPFATRPPLQIAQKVNVYRPAAYSELELTPYRRLKLVPGFRVDYSKDTERWDLNPRFNTRFAVVEEFPRTTLKGGMGMFSKPPEYEESIPPFGTRGLRSNRATHYSIGVEQDLLRQVEVSVEGFYKVLDQLVSSAPSADGNGTVYNNLGKGYVVGSEILLKYKPDKRFFGWLAYTLSRSVRQRAPDQPQNLFQWDQTHILTVLGSYRLGHGWEFGARFRIVSGNLTTPIVGSLYNANSGSYVPLNSMNPFSQRLPLFNQLDLRIDKKWVHADGGIFSMYLDVQNVYYAQNVEGYAYNYNFSQKSKITGLPIIPSIGIRGEF
ncbi:MAG: TonB family protein [Deltaproteobacteria bacterium]|nr:TonB family protein [Deltaproteobacteria bacterium]